MKEEFLKGITESITNKLGEENAGIIADDIGKLITANSEALQNIKNLTEANTTLKEKNEKLILANGSLLQQIPSSISEYDKHQSEEEKEEKKAFNFHAVFDKNGNFKNEL